MLAVEQRGVNSWAVVEAEINRIIVSAKDPFPPETVAQVQDLLQFVRNHCPIPEIGKGYWNTIRFIWQKTTRGPFEIEVFSTQFETYRFHDHNADIRHILHVPGEPLPSDLIAELPTS
jgi:hypothetical protein